MFAMQSLDDARDLLSRIYDERLRGSPPPGELETLRFPVGLFLVREDGAGGSRLASEVVGSFAYWDARSGWFFDGIFLGWGFDGSPAYVGHDSFVKCVSELEGKLDWRYKGGAQLLLADFVFVPRSGRGDFDFSSAIDIDITRLLEEEKLAQLGELMERLIRPMKKRKGADGATPTWQISDYLGALQTRRSMWKGLVEWLGPILGWADAMAPYAVRDMRKKEREA
jgi:hypothetical protein